VLLVYTHPVAELQVSSVQTFKSLQVKGLPGWQDPPPQVSFTVQAFPSLQEAVLGVYTHPVDGLQESVVHTFESLQTNGVPPWQVPPEQISPVVQAFPSLQDALLGVYTHPVAGLHVSLVHTFESLQTTAVPPQVPPEQISPAVQAFPSLHDAVLLLYTHPVAGLHVSLVHTFESLQTNGVPPQLPPEQTSPVVQAFPSLQEAVLGVYTHPVDGLQESVVHTFESLQTNGVPPWQVPPEHISPVVQAFPSLQDALLGVYTHPVAGLQESSVQMFPSLQTRGVPGWQLPSPQVSFTVQASASSQGSVLLVYTQPDAGLQESSVQMFASLQTRGVPATH